MTSEADERARELEAELATTRRLAALGTLTLPLAHELTALLGAIASHTERALGERTNLTNDHALAQVLGATSRARSIVEQLHRHARRQTKDLVPLDLGLIASEGLRLLRLTIPGSISVQVAIASDLDLVLADQMAAHQVLVSLVAGSAGTLRPGDGLHVSVEPCTLGAELAASHARRAGRYVGLTVRSSSGSGNRSAEAQGWGFELAVVEGIVHEHGGIVIAETSREGARSVACLFPALERQTTSGEIATAGARP
jgi:two-component system, cell cycle sensor histidine kinase and response regulator CckA